MTSFFTETADYISDWLPELLVAASNTLQMAALAFCVAIVLGLVICLAGLSRRKLLRMPAKVYVEVIRGAPALALLFLIYFGLTNVGIVLPAFEAAVVGLGLNGAAYVAEIYRAGIQSVDRGQTEAALTIGMTRSQLMRYIILPQAFRVVLPPLGNYAIGLLKDTSIASLIGAPELTLRARDLTSEYFMPMQIYILSGAIYFIMAAPLAAFVRWLEVKLSRKRARPVKAVS